MDSSYAPKEQQRKRQIVTQIEEISPYVLMGEVLEKLKMLGYEQNFIRTKFILLNFSLTILLSPHSKILVH